MERNGARLEEHRRQLEKAIQDFGNGDFRRVFDELDEALGPLLRLAERLDGMAKDRSRSRPETEHARAGYLKMLDAYASMVSACTEVIAGFEAEAERRRPVLADDAEEPSRR